MNQALNHHLSLNVACLSEYCVTTANLKSTKSGRLRPRVLKCESYSEMNLRGLNIRDKGTVLMILSLTAMAVSQVKAR